MATNPRGILPQRQDNALQTWEFRSTENILKGEIVVCSGTDPGEQTVELARAGVNVVAGFDRRLYRAQHHCPLGDFGRFSIRELVPFTHGRTLGAPLWLSSSTPGATTPIKPSTAIQVGECCGPNFYVFHGDLGASVASAAVNHLGTKTYWVDSDTAVTGVDGREWPTMVSAITQADSDLAANATVRLELSPGQTHTLPGSFSGDLNYHVVGSLQRDEAGVGALNGTAAFLLDGPRQFITFENVQFGDGTADVILTFVHNQTVTFINCSFQSTGFDVKINVSMLNSANSTQTTDIFTIGCVGSPIIDQTSIGVAPTNTNWTDSGGDFTQSSNGAGYNLMSLFRGDVKFTNTSIQRSSVAANKPLFSAINPPGSTVNISFTGVNVSTENSDLLAHTGAGVAPGFIADANTRLNIKAWGVTPTLSPNDQKDGGPVVKLSAAGQQYKLPAATGDVHPIGMAASYDTFEAGHGHATYSKEYDAIYGKVDVVEMTATGYVGDFSVDATRTDNGSVWFNIPIGGRLAMRVNRVSFNGGNHQWIAQEFIVWNPAGTPASAAGTVDILVNPAAAAAGIALTFTTSKFKIASTLDTGWESRFYIEFLPLIKTGGW